jgi:hypothetical protein
MPEAQQAPPSEKRYPESLRLILERARNGDAASLKELKQAYDDHPELVGMFGNLVEQTQQALLTLIAGNDLITREAITRKVAALRNDLAAEGVSSLESLLVDRIVLDWLAVHHADNDVAGKEHANPSAHPATRAAVQRQNAAHRRYLASIRCLAMTRKLIRPALSPLDLLRQPVGEVAKKPASMDRCSRSASVPEGVPVAN